MTMKYRNMQWLTDRNVLYLYSLNTPQSTTLGVNLLLGSLIEF